MYECREDSSKSKNGPPQCPMLCGLYQKRAILGTDGSTSPTDSSPFLDNKAPDRTNDQGLIYWGTMNRFIVYSFGLCRENQQALSLFVAFEAQLV